MAKNFPITFLIHLPYTLEFGFEFLFDGAKCSTTITEETLIPFMQDRHPVAIDFLAFSYAGNRNGIRFVLQKEIEHEPTENMLETFAEEQGNFFIESLTYFGIELLHADVNCPFSLYGGEECTIGRDIQKTGVDSKGLFRIWRRNLLTP